MEVLWFSGTVTLIIAALKLVTKILCRIMYILLYAATKCELC